MALQWLPCQAPGVIGSVLGLVGLVSVYCDWVRRKVWSATSISVWQPVNCLSRPVPEIRLHVAETLSNQPTNKPCLQATRNPMTRTQNTDVCQDRQWHGYFHIPFFTYEYSPVKDITWHQHITNEVLYGGLPKITLNIKRKTPQTQWSLLEEQEWSHTQLILILWEPKHGRRKRRGGGGGGGVPHICRSTGMEADTGIPWECLPSAMEEREGCCCLLVA